MKKIDCLKMCVAFLVGVGLMVGIYLLFLKPDPVKPNVIINPTKKELRKADIALVQKDKVEVSGVTKTEPTHIKTQVTIPVTGSRRTDIVDNKTKKIIATDNHAVEGTTTVTIDNDKITAKTEITDENTIAINIKKPKPFLLFEARYTNTGDYVMQAGYVLRTYQVGTLQISPVVGATYSKINQASDIQYYVGLHAVLQRKER